MTKHTAKQVTRSNVLVGVLQDFCDLGLLSMLKRLIDQYDGIINNNGSHKDKEIFRCIEKELLQMQDLEAFFGRGSALNIHHSEISKYSNIEQTLITADMLDNAVYFHNTYSR